MNFCRNDIYFILIFIILGYLVYKDLTKKEGFDATSDATSDVKAAIGQVYNADIEAIRNLSEIASKLQQGGLTVPGNLLLQSGTFIDFGSNDTAREANAGKIGYALFDDSLNIVGKGNPGVPRRTTLWDSLKVVGRLSTNGYDPNNIPAGWGGGLRTWDVYAGGTVGLGSQDATVLNAYMNSLGDAYLSNSLKIGSWTLRDNGGLLEFIKEGVIKPTTVDPNSVPQDNGYIAMSGDGNMWLSRSSYRGWVADNLNGMVRKP